MRRIPRRVFLTSSAAAFGGAALAQNTSVPEPIRTLKPMLDGIQPISAGERRARVAKAQRLMAAQKIGALVMEPGATMFYFTGTRAAGLTLVLPARGDAIWIAPEGHGTAPAGDVRTFSENDG